MSQIRVFIIDDSALTRAILTKILEKDPDIKVVGAAADPIIAEKKLHSIQADVITLDIEMPRMNGLLFLEKMMKESPIPTIVISGNSPKSSINAIKSLELGAIEIIEKPDLSTPEKLNAVSTIITESVKTAFTAKNIHFDLFKKVTVTDKKNKEVNIRIANKHNPAEKITLIGASTGGPDLIRYLLSRIEHFESGYVVAQHMPALFTSSFAERLNQLTNFSVKEAQDGDYIEKGKVLVLPGDRHGIIERDVKGFKIKLNQYEKVNRHRPSVDVLFRSGLKIPRMHLKAILLTGMGDDGSRGLKELRDHGALTIAQEANSCVVYGMPKKAIEIGAASLVLPPDQIIEELNKIN